MEEKKCGCCGCSEEVKETTNDTCDCSETCECTEENNCGCMDK